MTRTCLLFALLLMALPAAAAHALTGDAVVEATVTVHPDRVICPLQPTLFGINVHPHAKANIHKPEVVERVRALGFKSVRFPNGCIADIYNWKNPGDNWATVEDFLFLCDSLDAEPYYTLNLQGGTEGLQGPAPEGLPLDEAVKYQHLMPNPCGNTNYTFHTLADTLEFFQKYTIERALAGKRPILHYEMGNENWGQSTTDWPPELYAKTVEIWSTAMREALAKAAEQHPELAALQLHIVAVGYPIMGNNMHLVDNPDRRINGRWTSALNKLYEQKVIDAVQEHFYPYGAADGGTLAWAAHNLHNILCTRRGLPNPRLDGYLDPGLVYKMPLEHTEWNVKCWGARFVSLDVSNPSFESGLEGWEVSGREARAASWAARRGAKGVRLTLRPGDPPVAIGQVIQLKGDMKIVTAAIWARTDSPTALKLSWEYLGKKLGTWHTTTAGRWQRVTATTPRPETATQLRLVARVDEPATVYVDDVAALYSLADRGHNPPSAEYYEQTLFCVDALRALALAGTPRAHLHHMFGNYPCGTLAMNGEYRDLSNTFRLFNGAYGTQVVQAECTSETFPYASGAGKWSTHFNALAPDLEDVPSLACLASKKDNTLYLLLLNRSSDRTIRASIDLGGESAQETATVRTLSGTDVDVYGSSISETVVPVSGRTMVQVVEPYSASIITVPLKGTR